MLFTPLGYPAADAAPDLDGWVVGKGHRDIHTVAWRLVDRDELPRNEESAG